MKQAEFNRWLQDYQVRFPDTAAWIASQPKRQDMLSVWQEALVNVDLGDALEVNRRLTRGDDDHWPAYEREETPAKLRKLAFALQRSRGNTSEPEQPRENVTPSAFPIGILFRQLVEVNERWAKVPDFDKQAEHDRLKAAFLDKYGAKPTPNETLSAYSQREFAP